MRSFALFFLYIVGAYGVAALLSVGLAEVVTEIPQNKLISRGGLLLAVLGFWPFLKWLRLTGKSNLGYQLPAAQFWKRLALGWVFGVVILICLTAALLLLEIRIVNGPAYFPEPIKIILQGLLAGLAVAFIEETFFRGAMFQAIRRNGGGIFAALTLTSLLYAALHFFKPQALPPDSAPSFANAITAYLSAFEHLFQLSHLDSFAALFLVGLFLALVRWRTGHIGWSIGLHAGWVLVIKLTHGYTHLDETAPMSFLVGSYDDVIGWLAAGWIGVLCLIPLLWPGRRSTRIEGAA